MQYSIQSSQRVSKKKLSYIQTHNLKLTVLGGTMYEHTFVKHILYMSIKLQNPLRLLNYQVLKSKLSQFTSKTQGNCIQSSQTKKPSYLQQVQTNTLQITVLGGSTYNL